MVAHYDALLILSFGGPEGPDDVIPFLENVLRGRNVPRERLLQVAEHYQLFGGVSPINAQNRALIDALRVEFAATGLNLPIYWGNRNWHPLLPDTLRQMTEDGVRHALAFVTSAFGSYSGCRQYLEDIARTRAQLGASTPHVDKLRGFYNHPGFIEPMVERVRESLRQISASPSGGLQFLYTAHSIPMAMAATCEYQAQLEEACRLVSAGAGTTQWQLVYQSRSGPPSQAWLEPDVCDRLRQIGQEAAVGDVLLVPIGFVSDHMEVIYDLDVEARQVGSEVGLNVHRTATVGTHPRFVSMIGELVVERICENPQRLALGNRGPEPDICPPDCCRYQPRRPQPSA